MSSSPDSIPGARGLPGVDVREPGSGDGEPGSAQPEPGIPIRRHLDDRWLMIVLIPLFGLSISHGTGLYAGLHPGVAAWWWGHAWFVGGAALIYGCNRALLLAGREHADWFSRPVSKLVLLATGVLFGTLPPTVVMIWFWGALSGVDVSTALPLVTAINVVCVVFVTWLYETLFLIRERVDDQVRVERARAAQSEAELAALRAQVDPHFLFNALNTLAALIETEPADARAFLDHLARVYRGLLDTRGRPLVPLAEELELARAYAALLHVRFGDAVRTEFRGEAGARLVPPGAAQVLLENAVRHNAIDPAAPLVVDVDATGPDLVVSHWRRPRTGTAGSGVGLSNLAARAEATTGRTITVDPGERFTVSVPLVEAR